MGPDRIAGFSCLYETAADRVPERLVGGRQVGSGAEARVAGPQRGRGPVGHL
jgi:hypothetical protein